MGRYKTSEVVRWPPEVKEAAKFVMDWALDNSEASVTQPLLSAALAVINGNYKADAIKDGLDKPDGRTALYGVRIAAVHPESGDYLAAGPWTYGLAGMDAVWKYVSENAWQLYEGMEAMPIELTEADLRERTNTARVAMSRRADGVAVVRVRFSWQKKYERKNIRRGADPSEVVATSWSTQAAQVNVWIAPTEAARAMDVAERAARHPLAYLE